MKAKFYLLRGVDRQTRVDADSAASSGAVKCIGGVSADAAADGRQCDSRGGRPAGINPCAEVADDSKNFIVATARLKGGLNHEVRGLIGGIAGSVNEIEETAAGTGSTDKEGSWRGVVGDGDLRSLHGEADPGFIVEILGDAEAVLPSPSKANAILSVDSQGSHFRAVVEGLFGFRGQAPHLAASERPAV